MFKHLDGRGIRIVSKRGERVISPNEELVVRGEGLPRRGAKGSRGDLIIRFEVEMPGVSWAARATSSVSLGLWFFDLGWRELMVGDDSGFAAGVTGDEPVTGCHRGEDVGCVAVGRL